MTARVLVVGVLLLSGCALDEPDPSQVLTIDTCPEGAPCAAVADGTSQLTVEGCTAAQTRASNLEITLATSAGTFPGSTDGTTTRRVDSGGCATASLTVPKVPGVLQLEASTADVHAEPVYYTLAAVAPRLVEPSAEPATLSADATETKISAHVFAASGRPSDGTVVEFEAVSIEPADAFVDVRPRFANLDDDDVASATLVVDASVQSVEVTVTASHPTLEDSVTETMTVRRIASGS